MRTFSLCICFAVILTATASARRHKTSYLVKEVRDMMTSAPKDQETCFSHEMPCDAKLVEFAKTAKASLDIAIYDINLDQLVHHVLVLSKKMPIRIVVNKKQAKGSHSLVPLLIKAGASVRYGKQCGIMHDKFTIVDGKMIETGSFNYTNYAATSNQENQIYLANPSVVDLYKKRFDSMWASAFKAE